VLRENLKSTAEVVKFHQQQSESYDWWKSKK